MTEKTIQDNRAIFELLIDECTNMRRAGREPTAIVFGYEAWDDFKSCSVELAHRTSVLPPIFLGCEINYQPDLSCYLQIKSKAETVALRVNKR